MSSNEVDQAVAAAPTVAGPALLELDEDQWLLRKSARVGPKELGVALVAFANAEGGLVVVGLHDGRVEGVGSGVRKANDLRQAAMDYTVPPVPHHVEQVGCVNDDGEADVRRRPASAMISRCAVDHRGARGTAQSWCVEAVPVPAMRRLPTRPVCASTRSVRGCSQSVRAIW